MINAIIAETGAEISVEQDGTIFVTGPMEGVEKAIEKIKEITREYQVGETFEGKVSRIFDFGAMVEFAPRQEGLVHISELAPFRVGKVTDIVDIGDSVPIKIVGIDEMGRFNLSIKAVAELKPKEGRSSSSAPEGHGQRHAGRGSGERESWQRKRRN